MADPDDSSMWDPNRRFEEEAQKAWAARGAGRVLGGEEVSAAPSDAPSEAPTAPEEGVLPTRPLPPFSRWSAENTIHRLGKSAAWTGSPALQRRELCLTTGPPCAEQQAEQQANPVHIPNTPRAPLPSDERLMQVAVAWPHCAPTAAY